MDNILCRAWSSPIAEHRHLGLLDAFVGPTSLSVSLASQTLCILSKRLPAHCVLSLTANTVASSLRASPG